MQIKVQTIIRFNDGHEEMSEVGYINKDYERLEAIGLSLDEAKTVLKNIQERVVTAQTQAYLQDQKQCEHCGAQRRNKDSRTVTFRTLFGKLRLQSPRLYHCPCRAQEGKTFSPLTQLLPERTSPELLFLESKWASLVSYGMTAKLIQDVLPVHETFNEATVRNHLLKVAERNEEGLGEERHSYITGCPREWGKLPTPNGPLFVGIDGGFIRSRHKGKHFEVIAGKSILTFKRDELESNASAKCFGFVNVYDSKPKRRFFEMLKSQGIQLNQQITFLSDGGDTVRELQTFLSPEAEYLLDWFHVTMRLTVLKQTAKGLPIKGWGLIEGKDKVITRLVQIKHFLWHGNVYKALRKIESLELDLECVELDNPSPVTKKLYRYVCELRSYIGNNQGYIPNYGERYRNGERISTGFVESTINQVVAKRFVKKQQMQWTQRGAHLLLQVRTKVLNDELDNMFRQWYPSFMSKSADELPMAA